MLEKPTKGLADVNHLRGQDLRLLKEVADLERSSPEAGFGRLGFGRLNPAVRSSLVSVLGFTLFNPTYSRPSIRDMTRMAASDRGEFRTSGEVWRSSSPFRAISLKLFSAADWAIASAAGK
jgi:hypothetical protein